MVPPIAKLHCSLYKLHTTHNFLIRSDEGLPLKMLALEFLYDGQITLPTLLQNQTVFSLYE